MSVTTPSCGADTLCSIFIASSTTIGVPAVDVRRPARPRAGPRCRASGPAASPGRPAAAGSGNRGSSVSCAAAQGAVHVPGAAVGCRTVKSRRIPSMSAIDQAGGGLAEQQSGDWLAVDRRGDGCAAEPVADVELVAVAGSNVTCWSWLGTLRQPDGMPRSTGRVRPAGGLAGQRRGQRVQPRCRWRRARTGPAASGSCRSGSRCRSGPSWNSGSRRMPTSRSRLLVTPCSRASARQRASRRRAASRVGPCAITLASIAS